jgi:hypothetical protein
VRSSAEIDLGELRNVVRRHACEYPISEWSTRETNQADLLPETKCSILRPSDASRVHSVPPHRSGNVRERLCEDLGLFRIIRLNQLVGALACS